MASARPHLPPWDRLNVEQQELFDMSEYKSVLNLSRITLRGNLRLANVWPHLRQMEVMDQNDEDRMRLNATNADSVDRLIAFLNTCEVWAYHALLRAMALTHQDHLIPPGGLGRAAYMDSVAASDHGVMADRRAGPKGSVTKPDLAALAQNIQQELRTGEVRLLASTGIRGLTSNTVFIAHLRSLRILMEYNIEEIEACGTPSDKVSKLLRCLMPCRPSKYVLLAWVLVELQQDHQLTSITKDVRTYLRQLSPHDARHLEDDMDD